jgi:type III pantothenate kinase
MHNLVIDIGNTNSKLAVYHERTLVEYQTLKQVTPELVNELIERYDIQNSTVSSVGEQPTELAEILNKRTNYIKFSTAVNTGIENHYQTSATLGLDRWAKILAAHHYYRGTNCFIIDAGTCITYDLLSAGGAYFGGSISLGIGMRFEALHHFTKRLPLATWNKEDEIPDGIDTISAIKNGVLQGAVNEVAGFIAHQNIKYKDLKVLFTGGDAAFLTEQLKNSIFAPQITQDPYLVLKGLNEVIAFEYVQKN